jgi:coenzyme F420 hydrogenase subunit beta
MLRPAPYRDLCTDCGVSRLAEPKSCATACQFIKPDYPAMEEAVHGRARDVANPEELAFGPHLTLHRAAMKRPAEGAQWTGIATGIGARLLEKRLVDAVLTIAPDPDDQWKPMPVIITDPADMAKARGMRMGYAPLLALLEPARAAGHKRLAVIGIPCQVHALRRLESELGLEALYVIGTPCSDNTTTEKFHSFLDLLSDDPSSITYLEFRADFHVELRFRDGRKKEIPFLKLPISKLPPDFFPLTCRTCVDYANALSDITIGYMGGSGAQWLIVRNEKGRELLSLLGDDVLLETPRRSGRRKGAVTGFIENTRRAAGGLPLRAMPDWLRPLMGWLMPKLGPKGLEFAHARLEMKAAETVLHLARAEPKRMKRMIPDHVWRLVAPYGLKPD